MLTVPSVNAGQRQFASAFKKVNFLAPVNRGTVAVRVFLKPFCQVLVKMLSVMQPFS